MSYIKNVKDTLGDVISKGKDIIKGGAGQVADIFGKRDLMKRYDSDILFQTSTGSTREILKTIEAIYNDDDLQIEEKIVLLQKGLLKTRTECVKYRSRFYQALLAQRVADISHDEEQYLFAIDGFSQVIGEYDKEIEEEPVEDETVAQKWGRGILKVFEEIGKEIRVDAHTLTMGLLGSDQDDPEKELAKSFKESPSSEIGTLVINERNCNSFCHFKIAESYERIGNIDDARIWYIRASSSKNTVIKQWAKRGYEKMNPQFIQSFVSKIPSARANILFFQNYESMSGYYDPIHIIVPFEMSGFPSGLTFSTNRPKAGVLYQIHPCLDSYYLEYENYDSIIFKEQISEFLRLCQGVGAEFIEFDVKEGKSIDKEELSSFTGALNVEYKPQTLPMEGSEVADNTMKVGSQFTSSKKSRKQSRVSSLNSKTIELGHLRTRFIPDDLVWAGKEGWEEGTNLIKDYRNGVRLKNYTATFKTSSYQKDHLRSDANLKVSYEQAAITVSGEINQSEDTTFTKKDGKEWLLHVHFAKRGIAGFIERILRLFR